MAFLEERAKSAVFPMGFGFSGNHKVGKKREDFFVNMWYNAIVKSRHRGADADLRSVYFGAVGREYYLHFQIISARRIYHICKANIS